MKKEIIKKIVITIAISLLIAIVVQLINYYIVGNHIKYSFHKVVFYASVISFMLFHIMFDIEKLYSFIIKNRYKIACFILLFSTIMQFTNSSNSYYSIVTFEKDKYNSIFGKEVSYLSDEYAVETPIAISQFFNHFNYYNSLLRGVPTDVFSIVHPPILHFLSIGKMYNIGFVLGPHMGLAFDNSFKTLFLALATFELMELITNKKSYYSLLGSFVVAASFASQAQISTSLMIACGETIIVLLDRFLNEKSIKKKVLYMLGIALSGITYIFRFYPAYIIPFGYLFLALAIWIILKNKNNYKPCIMDFVLIGAALLFVALIGLCYYYKSYDSLKIITSTAYPGGRISKPYNGFYLTFTYLYNFLLPCILFENNFAAASIFGLFPIPLILSFVILKNKDKEEMKFFIPLTIYTIFIGIFVICGFPNIISQITLMRYSIQERTAVALALGSFYTLMYIFANVQNDFFKKNIKIIIIFLFMIVIALFALPSEIIENRILLSIVPSIFCLLAYCLLNNDKKEYRIIFTFVLILVTLPGLFFRPVTIGAHAITDLDISKKIQELSKDDSLWIGADLPRGLSNILIANGAKTVSSISPYPNEEMYQSLLGDKAIEKENDWNRYAQFKTELSNINDVENPEEYEDVINLFINNDGLKKLNIKYLLTYDSEEVLKSKGINATKVYEKLNTSKTTVENTIPSGIYIYEIN